jgi:hypothetical protein
MKLTDFENHFVSGEVIVAYEAVDNNEDSGYNLDVFVFAEDGTDITNELTPYELQCYEEEVEEHIQALNDDWELV